MSISERRERDRAERHRLILRTARELAEAEGWDAVTTRRLADRIEYSQPVLYSHFAGKDAIVTAIALQGFTELATTIRTPTPPDGHARSADGDAGSAEGDAESVGWDARSAEGDTGAVGGAAEGALRAMAEAYCDYAAANPAVYDAMFVLRTDLPFAVEDSPEPLRDAYAALRAVVAPVAAGRDPDDLTELAWAALHGLVTLTRAHRLRPDHHPTRLTLLTHSLLP